MKREHALIGTRLLSGMLASPYGARRIVAVCKCGWASSPMREKADAQLAVIRHIDEKRVAS